MVCSSDAAVLIKIICSFCKLSASPSPFGDARAPHDADISIHRKADLNTKQ